MRFWHIFILFSGIIMLLLGVLFMINPSRISILLVGIVMIALGLILLVNYLNDSHEERDVKWILAEGSVTFLLGAILFLDNDVSNHTLNFMFGLWLLFSGYIRVIASFKARKLHIYGWIGLLLIGGVSAIIGFIPLINSISIVIVISLFFITQGLNAFSTYYYLEKL